jgi:hypothetical protein
VSDRDRRQWKPGFDRTLWLLWILVTTLGWLVGSAFLGEWAVGLTVGAGQWLILRWAAEDHPVIVRPIWWLPATAAGWAVGATIVVLVLPQEVGLLPGAVLGAATGLAQWPILRRWARGSSWWVLLSALGWSAGLTGVLGVSFVGAIAGAVTGFVLDLLLRQSRLRRPRTE